MLENEIIQPANSLWNAPVILVKRDGSLCFVSGFQSLNNDDTIKYWHSLPQISCYQQNWTGLFIFQLSTVCLHIGLLLSQRMTKRKLPLLDLVQRLMV